MIMSSFAHPRKKILTPMSLVTIKSSHYESDLSVLKAKLESEGIPCFLKNQFTTQVMNHLAPLAVELQVSELDVEKAVEIMNDFDAK